MIDLLDIVLEEVVKATGMTAKDILGDSKVCDAVDARYMAVYHAMMLGVSTDRIAERFGRTRKSVINRMFTQYSTRRTTDFRVKSEAIKLEVCKRIAVYERENAADMGILYQYSICTENTRLQSYIKEAD